MNVTLCGIADVLQIEPRVFGYQIIFSLIMRIK